MSKGEHLIFVKTLLLPSSSFLLPPSKRASQQERLKTPIASWAAFIEMLPVQRASYNHIRHLMPSRAPQNNSPPSSPFPNSFTARALRLTKQSHALFPFPYLLSG